MFYNNNDSIFGKYKPVINKFCLKCEKIKQTKKTISANFPTNFVNIGIFLVKQKKNVIIKSLHSKC